ncbi:hypothetical protein [uncultured Gimesia sp.]|uniref:hypothetical protein n=1 Tax=uncultured Gimesia sp. TaxID=1678688 RepID=UPI002629A7C2|nr:hypothetical protein [uncultured Gimesia sp.]
MNHPNKELLDEVNRANSWFAARKTKCLWAQEVTDDQSVSTLEGELIAKAGDYLCRGESGDTWPQKAKTLFSKYEATEEHDNAGWIKFSPKPEAAGVLAVQIKHAFQVIASWGELTGQPDDYLVKNEADKNVEYPEDVWIVNRAIFEGTYEVTASRD